MMGNSDSIPEPPPVEGFFKTTWTQRAHWLDWDLFVAVLVTTAAVVFVNSITLEKILKDLLVAEFGLIGAVLGVVIAGLAIVVAFLSREYARVLMKADDGPIGDFWPFWFVAVLAATAVLAAGSGIVIEAQWPPLRRTVFGVTTFFSTYAVLATVNLVAFVAQQGVTRAWQLARKPPEPPL
jgi:hypothetical protein